MKSEAQIPNSAPKQKAYTADEIELIVGFGEECEEKLNDLESLVLVFETEPQELEHARGIYRILHTVKGTAASVGLPDLGHWAHQFEDFIVPFRDGKATPSARQFSVILAGVEWLKNYFAKLKSGVVAEIETEYWTSIRQGQKSGDEHKPKESTGFGAVAKPTKDQQRKISIDLEVIDLLLARSGNLMILQDLVLHDLEEMSRRSPNDAFVKNCLGHLNEMKKENDVLQANVSRFKKTNISAAIRIVQRTIRDLAIQLGKQVQLEMLGTNVPIDLDVCQIITDSLVHLVRNALDHGIEPPEERKQKGKAPQATIKISILQRNEELRIEIMDDGRGIDVEKVKAKALKSGVISAEKLEQLSQDSICKLIFESGFSTAEKVTEVSGRGVGLDMVMKAITSIKGQVHVSSRLNIGTIFVITIPEKKASHISKSFVSTCNGYQLAFAGEYVGDINDLAFLKSQNRILAVDNKLYLLLDQQYIPILNPVTGQSPDATTPQGMVCVVLGQKSLYALMVDEIHSLEKVIVKDIMSGLDTRTGFSKAALTGRYGLVLFLDLAQLGDVA